MITAIMTAIKSVCDMVGKIEDKRQNDVDHQSEININKSYKNASKAIKAANKALDIATIYIQVMSKKDSKSFQKYKKIFDNNIGSK